MENHENNDINASHIISNEIVLENKNETTSIEINTNIELPKKLTLKDINPEDLKIKIEGFFNEKLENFESKFRNDLEIVEPYKHEFIDLYHDLENLKLEILDFLRKEEEKKQIKPATNSTAIRRNDTSRSRTPMKSITSKVASTKDVTKSANNKISLETNSKINDKNRSQTPLTAKKLNEKSQKEVSVKKVDTKKTINSNLDTTINNQKNELKTPNANKDKNTNQNASDKKRDMTPNVSVKNKALDTSVISHNDTANVQNTHSNNPAKNAKRSSVIKQDKNSNHISNLKKPSETNENKRKSTVNVNAGTSDEAQSVSNFSNTLNSTGKKKSILGALNSTIQGETTENNISQKELENFNSYNKRTSINKGNQKGERKSSMPAQRASLGGNKRNSVEMQKINNSFVEENAKSKEKNNNDLEEINDIEKCDKKELDKDKLENKSNKGVKKEEENKLKDLSDNIENKNIIHESKILDTNTEQERKSINEMNHIVKNENTDITNNNEITQKRNSFSNERNLETNKSEEKPNLHTIKIDEKSKEDRKKSISTFEKNKPENHINENLKKIEDEVINNTAFIKKNDEIINTKFSNENEGKKTNNQISRPDNFLLNYSNKKNCGLNLLIKSG